MHWSRCQELRVICWLSLPQTVVFLQLPSSPLFLILLNPLSRFSLSLHCTEPELLVTVALTASYWKTFRVVKWWKFDPVDTSDVPAQNTAAVAASPAIYILDVSACEWSLWSIRIRLVGGLWPRCTSDPRCLFVGLWEGRHNDFCYFQRSSLSKEFRGTPYITVNNTLPLDECLNRVVHFPCFFDMREFRNIPP